MEKARELEPDGWVRNRDDGSVEALVSGVIDRLTVWEHCGPIALPAGTKTGKCLATV
jgi:hypothetical protein